jgi:hypothetical protein
MASPITSLINISEDELKRLLTEAAVLGAKQALQDIGLHDDNAAKDIEDVRGLLSSWRETKSEMWKTFVHWFTAGLLALIGYAVVMYVKPK